MADETEASGNASPWAAPPVPAGYQVYGAVRDGVESTTTLRTWSIVARFVGAGFLALAGWLQFRRADAIERLADGRGSRGAVESAETAATVVYQLSSFAVVAGTVLVLLWTWRTVNNGKQVHADSRARPGLAAGGWFIPIGNLWVPWQQMRRAMGGARSGALGWWQGLTAASMGPGIAAGGFGAVIAVREALDREVGAGTVRAYGSWVLVTAVATVATTAVSIRAMRDVDDATSGAIRWPS